MRYAFILILFSALQCVAQQGDLLSKVTTTPDDVLKKFVDAGMSPTEHPLTAEERNIVATTFDALPPLHKRVLKRHLKSISFLDNMPNTALTSTLEGDSTFHITFRAGILHQTISEWATGKERTCFAGGDSTISVSIQAGMLNAFVYVLLHEGTHVVDGSLHLSANPVFAKNVWKDINTVEWKGTDSIVFKSRFRAGGRAFLTTEACRVYAAMAQGPFVSLYGTASWHEDMAELLTVYHLTRVLKQRFRVVVEQGGKELCSFEPMRNGVVRERVRGLREFYGKY